MKKRKRRPVARNLLIPVLRPDGRYNITPTGLSHLYVLILNRLEEVMQTYEVYNYAAALTKKQIARVRQRALYAENCYEKGRHGYLADSPDSMNLLSEAFDTLREIIIGMNENAHEVGYYMPYFHYVSERPNIPEPTPEEIRLLQKLAFQKNEVWKSYWDYVNNIGFRFSQSDSFWYLSVYAEAAKLYKEARAAMMQGEDLFSLRVSFLSAIHVITGVTDHLWEFTDPKGIGPKIFEEEGSFSMAAYAEYTKARIARGEPIGSVRESLPAIQEWARVRGYLEPGGEPPPPPLDPGIFEPFV